MTLQTISVEVSARRIATVTLNRPERGNGRHFCTGADLAARGADTKAIVEQPAKAPATLRDVLVALDTLPKPTVAVVHGGAVGGGAAFAACCDVAIATATAFFSIPEVRVGMAPMGVMPFLIRAIGHRSFRRYGLSGERIAPADALRIGLVHQVCDAATLDDTLARIADELLHSAPDATAELKAAAAQFASPTLAAVLAHRPAHNPKTPEALEGIASFREKRKPGWYPQ